VQTKEKDGKKDGGIPLSELEDDDDDDAPAPTPTPTSGSDSNLTLLDELDDE